VTDVPGGRTDGVPATSGEPGRYPIEQARALGVLRNRHFLALWLSQVATQVGGNMVLYGLTIAIAGLSSSYSAVSLLFLTFLLPAVVFSPVAGVYVDRLDRRLILVVTNALRAVAFVAMLLAGDNLPVIYLLSLFVATSTTFFVPAESAMIPRVVHRDQLITANGLFLFTLNASFGIGFTMAGPLLLILAGYHALLLVVAVLYGAAALFCFTLPSGEGAAIQLSAGEAVAEAEVAVASTFGQLREGIAYIRTEPRISWSLTYLAVSSSLIGVLGVLGPLFAQRALALRPQDFVVVVIPLFAGLILGILLLNQYGRYLPRRRVIEGGLLALATLLVLLSVAGPLSRFLAGVETGLVDLGAVVSLLSIVTVLGFLAGLAYAVVAIPAQTQLQEELHEDIRGRVFGVLNMLLSLAALVPIVIVGPLADRLGSEVVIFGSGVAVGLLGLGSIVAAHPPVGISAAPHGRHVPVDPLSASFSLSRGPDELEAEGEDADPATGGRSAVGGP